jgi:hypothetical protein
MESQQINRNRKIPEEKNNSQKAEAHMKNRNENHGESGVRGKIIPSRAHARDRQKRGLLRRVGAAQNKECALLESLVDGISYTPTRSALTARRTSPPTGRPSSGVGPVIRFFF